MTRLGAPGDTLAEWRMEEREHPNNFFGDTKATHPSTFPIKLFGSWGAQRQKSAWASMSGEQRKEQQAVVVRMGDSKSRRTVNAVDNGSLAQGRLSLGLFGRQNYQHAATTSEDEDDLRSRCKCCSPAGGLDHRFQCLLGMGEQYR